MRSRRVCAIAALLLALLACGDPEPDGRTSVFSATACQRVDVEIASLVETFAGPDFYPMWEAARQLESLQDLAIPHVLPLLDREEVVEFGPESTVLHPRTDESDRFEGHGLFVAYDVESIPVRAGWWLEETTFQDFGFRELRPGDSARGAARAARAWGEGAKQDWTRLAALLDALSSPNVNRQRAAVFWLSSESSACDGFTHEVLRREVEPRLRVLASREPTTPSVDQVRHFASRLVRDIEDEEEWIAGRRWRLERVGADDRARLVRRCDEEEEPVADPARGSGYEDAAADPSASLLRDRRTPPNSQATPTPSR